LWFSVVMARFMRLEYVIASHGLITTKYKYIPKGSHVKIILIDVSCELVFFRTLDLKEAGFFS
jgi:hypothetical protein